MASLVSVTENWDSDPDLILPDGPLTLLHSDSDHEINPSQDSLNLIHKDWLPNHFSDSNPNTLHNKKLSHNHNHNHNNDDDDDDDLDRKGGTLRLKVVSRKSIVQLNHFEHNLNHQLSIPPPLHHLLSSSGDDRDEAEDSLSSNSSSERQSTIKASLSPLPQINSNQILPRHRLYRHSSKLSGRIDTSFLALLASGTQGTVTKLESSKKSSHLQPGLDWDQDLVLPEGGLKPVSSSIPPPDRSLLSLIKKPSFASPVSDNLNPSHTNCSSTSLSNTPADGPSKSLAKCETVDEEAPDFGLDFQLPSSSTTILTNPLSALAAPKSSSSLSLTGSDLDFMDDDDHLVLAPAKRSVPSSNASSRRGSLKMAGLPRSSSSSISLSISSLHTTDDLTPRIRTRPSLTPSLMSDRSSSPFTEIEDDPNDGFFDDIEFPPEFGISNNLPPSSSSSPAPALSSTLDSSKSGCLSSDPKGKQPNRGRSVVDLQSYLNLKVHARALMADRHNSHERRYPPHSAGPSSFSSIPPSSSSSSLPSSSSSVTQPASGSQSASSNFTITSSSQRNSLHRRNMRAFEDRDDERVEDGLEIEAGSFRPEKLRSRKNSSISSASSQTHNSARPSHFHHHAQRFGGSGPSAFTGPALHQQLSKQKRITSPTNLTYLAGAPGGASSAKSYIRSTLAQVNDDPTTQQRPTIPHIPLINRPTSALIPSPHTARLPGVQLPHRPLSAVLLASNPPTTTTRPPGVGAHASFIHVPSAESLKMPRFKPKGLRLSTSHGEIGQEDGRLDSAGSSLSPRVLSPHTAGQPRTAKSSGKPLSSSSATSRARTSIGPPVLTSNNQRSLKHKKSALALKSSAHTHAHHQHSGSNASDRLAAGTPPGSASTSASGQGRGALARKQSMPSLNNQDCHHHHGTRFSGGSQTPTGTSSHWKSYQRPKSRQQQLLEQPALPVATVSLTLATQVPPSYADPTTASLNKQTCSATTTLATIAGSPAVTRRGSGESGRGGAGSPGPGASRLTMPTIASRLKAKPSIIHEENQPGRRWTSGAMAVPHHLRRPRRARMYGDGTELDEFDDLPTSKEKEKMFTRVVKSTLSGAGRVAKVGTTEKRGTEKEASKVKSRSELRKAESVKRRAMAVGSMSGGGTSGKGVTKKGLIRQMSVNTLSKTSNNSEMRWNAREARWEGNELVLREFDNVLSSSSRPALISQLSIQTGGGGKSPTLVSSQGLEERRRSSGDKAAGIGGSGAEQVAGTVKNKGLSHVVGGMVFDAESMCWRAARGEEEELSLESDEELELRWQADDEGSCGGGGGVHQENQGGCRRRLEGWGDEAEEEEEEEDGKRHRKGVFWEECVCAQERHRAEVRAWIPMAVILEQETGNGARRLGHRAKQKSNASNCSTNNNGSSSSSKGQRGHYSSSSRLYSNYGYGYGYGYGRLSDPDRCYLQEIRKLVSEEQE